MKTIKKRLLLPLVILALLFAAVPAYADIPSMPHPFYGTLTISGSAASVGTVVTAKVAEVQVGSYTTTVAGQYGDHPNAYLIVGADIAIETGATINFYADGTVTDQTSAFSPGADPTELNLTITTPDTTDPTVTIDQESEQADPTNTSPINFTVVFNESVSDFATGDVTLGGTAGATTATVTGSGTTYNVAVSGMTSDGTVTASIAEGVAHDAADNPNTASTSTDNSVTYDTTDPTVTIDAVTTPTSVTTQTVTGGMETGATVVLTADTAASCGDVTTPTSTTWSCDVSGLVAGSNVITATATDAAGNTGTATDTIVLDTAAPTVSSTSPADADTDVAVNTAVTATFSKAMDESTITTSSFTLAGSAVSGAVTYNSGTKTATFTPSANLTVSTTYTATLSTAIKDDAGNPLAEAEVWSFTTTETAAVQYDLTVASTTGGTVTSPAEGTSTHNTGTVVNLVAAPDEDYTFGWWSGDVGTIADDDAASTTITMDSAKSIVANFVEFDAPENVSATEIDPGVESVTVTVEAVGDLDVTEMPAGTPQEAYVVVPTGTGSFTLTFTDVENASDIRVYKVVDSTWTLLEVTVVDATTIQVTMDVADPVLVFLIPPDAIATVTLSAGWNLLSTPILLDADSDAMEQIFDATSLANIDVSYRWDAVNEQWPQVVSGFELLPLEAIYVKVSSGASATAEFIPSQEISGLPSRELESGLNLIGPAPALEADDFSDTPLDLAVVSIEEASGGLRGYTMVVSPGLNQTAWSYALGGVVKDLVPFKGYWVVMENADTLFGFSTTPVSP